MNPYFFAFSHALSPSGDIVATITYNALDNDMDIVLISTRDGSVLRNITRGYTARYEYDQIRDRPLARQEPGLVARRRPAGLLRPRRAEARPVRHRRPDRGDAAQDQPRRRPARRAGLLSRRPEDHVHRLRPRPPRHLRRRPRRGRGREPDPRRALREGAGHLAGRDDGRLFGPRRRERQALPLADRRLLAQDAADLRPGQHRDPGVLPGRQDPVLRRRHAGRLQRLLARPGLGRAPPLHGRPDGELLPGPPAGPIRGRSSSAPSTRGPSSCSRRAPEPVAEQTLAFAEVEPGRPFPAFEPALKVDIDPALIKAQSGMGKLYISQRPPIDAMVASDGSIYGGSALAFSDILGDHQFSVMAYQVRELRSFALGYLNQKRRFQYSINAFQYTLYYYPYQYLLRPGALRPHPPERRDRHAEDLGRGRFGLLPPEQVHPPRGEPRPVQLRGGVSGLRLRTRGQRFRPVGDLLHQRHAAGRPISRSRPRRRASKPTGPPPAEPTASRSSPALPAASSFLQQHRPGRPTLRKYFSIGADVLLALRAQGFLSRGRNPFLGYYGGNNQVRSAYYYGIVGHGVLVRRGRAPVPAGRNGLDDRRAGRPHARRAVLRRHAQQVRALPGEVLPAGRRSRVSDVRESPDLRRDRLVRGRASSSSCSASPSTSNSPSGWSGRASESRFPSGRSGATPRSSGSATISNRKTALFGAGMRVRFEKGRGPRRSQKRA